jgi:hypothetical protein
MAGLLLFFQLIFRFALSAAASRNRYRWSDQPDSYHVRSVATEGSRR